MKIIGWVGMALVIVAYYPQIHHLLVERCAWGISVLTWLIWLAASVLLLTYCAVRRELLICAGQGVRLAATAFDRSSRRPVSSANGSKWSAELKKLAVSQPRPQAPQ